MTRAAKDIPQDPQAVEETPAKASTFNEVFRPEEGTDAVRGPERVLLMAGTISPEQLEQALATQAKQPHLSVLGALIASEIIDEETALKATAEYFELPFLRLTIGDVDPNVMELLPKEFATDKHVIAIRRDEQGILLGVADPADIFLIEDVGRRLHKSVHLAVVMPSDIAGILEELSAEMGEQVDDFIKDISEDSVEVVDDKEDEVADLEKIAGESPVIRYVNFMISSAVRDGVSDIHIEPGESKLKIRCRIDGVLFEQQAPPLQMHAAIISRLKIMANLDIAERRLPQDGKIRATVHGRTVDLRVSTLPTTQGEKCVIRILDGRSINVGLDKLGLSPGNLENLTEQILAPHGVVLVTGPTGSGKSTTLYAGMAIMESDKLNISTVEDPVEYEVPYANQVQCQESIGMTFAAALRSLLRQDPDVVMVGEIRDEETSRIAIQAALTGHLVLSTLHTNDAPSSVTRLINIGVEPFLISAALNAILAQRLVRTVCETCKEPMEEISDKHRRILEQAGLEVPDVLYRGKGCERCRNSGFKGRTGIHELLVINEEMRNVIIGNPNLQELKRAARDAGMRTLREDGLAKVVAGKTTIEEVLRVAE